MQLSIVQRFLLAVCLLCLGSCSNDNNTSPVDSALSADGTRQAIMATFVGTTTVLVSDGETQLLTDGFFTRPGVDELLSVAPDTQKIANALDALAVTDLAAVMVVHSHYDHAMDAPEVAMRTGAMLMGSESSANVGRGWGLDEQQIQVVTLEQPYRFGQFTVTFVPSRHLVGLLDDTGEVISEPLVPPTSFVNYKEGGAFSIHIAHPSGNLLIHASVNFEPGALEGYPADTIFLGIGGLGEQAPEFQEEYFQQTVSMVGAKTIVPVHWDDFFLPLLAPLPRGADFDGAMQYLEAKVEEDAELDIRFLDLMESIAL